MNETDFFGSEKIWKILARLAPPVMLAQLIQALYNIVDSFYVGRFSEAGLTALSIIYPVQLIIIAAAVGTGVGINTVMARYFGVGKRKRAEECAGTGTILAVSLWLVFAVFLYFFMPVYAAMSTSDAEVIEYTITYGRITSVFSLGIFTESVWSKVHQASGNMKTPMLAQIIGAVINIVLDPILIFGMFSMPRLGIAGAAIATVLGQFAAAFVVGRRGLKKPPVLSVIGKYVSNIYRAGVPAIMMQAAYTVYILGLNLILKGFSNQAVTALGLYYKWQTFFFIPLGGLQTCIVPVISYNYARGDLSRCKSILRESCIFGLLFMCIGIFCFEVLPRPLLMLFSRDPLVIQIGIWGFRCIGLSFIPLVTSMIFPVYFQATASGAESVTLTVVRTVVLFVPVAWLLSRFSLEAFWFTFPITDTVTSLLGFVFLLLEKKSRSLKRLEFQK